jgi:glycosyltransferase involved in cell wall biosynthesis
VHSVTDHSYVDLVRSGQLTGPVAKYLGYEARPYRWTLSNLYWRSQVLRASHILTPSDFARKEVIKFLDIPESRVTTTYLAVGRRFHQAPLPPDARSALLAGLHVREPYLLFVGGFEPHKNVPGLLDVFSRVHAAAPDYSLVIVGSKGIPNELARHARDMGLDPDGPVRFLSDLTDELPALYDAATLFVTMSWRETFCLPALEAMTRGVPVVASRWGALPEIVGKQGSLIDPRDHPRAASTILALLEHDNAAAAAAARRAAARFDWSTTCTQTLDVYRRVLGA